mgnify:CR=1 FL=1
MKKVLLIHGPNLNLTGQREPGIYGSNTLASINAEVVQKCERLGMECAVFQSNSEGALIDRIHAAREDCDAIIMNAGAYTHYSYAIRDAIAAVRLPAWRYICPTCTRARNSATSRSSDRCAQASLQASASTVICSPWMR